MFKHAKQKNHTFRLAPVCAAVLLAFSAQTIEANPNGGVVVNGQASFASSGNALTVTNTPGTIINWQSFSIQQNEITRFAQQSASSAVLNRVITNNPSNILGTLQSNGRVFLINPNGILFGQGATVDVAGLVATTLNLSNADFLAGRLNFTQQPGAQNISNAGSITAQQGGEIYLIAPNVDNSGIINAPNGDILLAAGHSVELVNSLDPNLRVNVTAPAGDATNVGQLIASSGSLGLFGAMVKNTGTVNADSATLQGGKIVLRASQRVEAGGTVSAQGVGGGEIKVLSDMQTGTVSVSGTLDASSLPSPTVGGAGGGGDGGFIETSAAHVQVADTAKVTTLAANGNHGTWLIDPPDFTIAATGGDMTGAAVATALAGGNVTILSSAGTVNLAGLGDIYVNDAITKTDIAATTLTLQAANNIVVATGIGITTTGAALGVVLNSDSDGIGGGAIVMNTGSSIVSGGGNVTLGGGTAGDGSGNAVGNAAYFDGIYLFNATLNAGGGHINMRGTGYAGTSSANGIYVTGTSSLQTSHIQTSGTGTITLNGTGGAGTGSNSGVRIGTNASITAVDGLISLTGQGGASTGTFNMGVYIHNSATVASTGMGGITLNGTGGSASATDHNTGIAIQSGAAVSVVDGALSLLGTSGAGMGMYNRGVNIQQGTVQASGIGSINITGHSNATATSSFGRGVELREGGLVQSASGAINITGDCATGSCGFGTSDNRGIYIHDATGGSGFGAAKVLSTSGAITLTGSSWGTGTPNYGIQLFNDIALTPTLSATVDTGAGGSSNISLVSTAGDIVLDAGTVLGANTSGNLLFNAGRDLIVGTALTRAAVGNVDFLAANNILFSATGSFAPSAGAVNINLISDSNGAGGGGIYLDTGSSIISNGGNITMGGMPSTGNAIGNGTVTGGITFNSGITVWGDITAGAGNVTMRGEGANNNLADGITFAGGKLSSNGIVNINGIAHGYSNGTGDPNNQFGAGVDFYNSGTRLTTQTGTVTITGINDAPNNDPTYYRADGIMVETGTVIETTGIGTLTFSGTTSSFNTSWGVGVLGGTIQTTAAGGGAITLTGFNTSGLPDGGVTIMNGNVLSNGGAINMIGQGLGGAVGVVGTSIIGGVNCGNISIVGMDAGPVAIGTGTILNAGNGNLSITSLSDINVDSTIQHGATPAAMSLQAGNNINFVGAGVNSTGALDVILRSDADANGTGTVSFAGTNTLNTLAGGRVDLYYNPTSYATPTTFTGITWGTTAHTEWMLVNNVTNLQDMNTNLAGNYALGAAINAAGTSIWNFNGTTYDGFAPIGSIATPFTGRFNGNAYTIDGLFINRSGASYVGLFGFTNASTIKNVSLTNVNITGGNYVGSLAGWHQGTLTNSSNASGTVAGTGFYGYVGGLVGMSYNGSTIDTCSAGSTVSGTNYVGGLIGASQQSSLSNVSATGNVTGTYWGAGGLVGSMEGNYFTGSSLFNATASGNVIGVTNVGGLVGWSGSYSTINTGVASGNVTGTNGVGGLVGMNAYNIVNSHASGGVSGVTGVGGLVGFNTWDYDTWGYITNGAIGNSYAIGAVSGTTSVGGLVGDSSSSAAYAISASYASGSVSGTTNVGGLAGFFSWSRIFNSYANGNVSGTGAANSNLGGLVGWLSAGTVDTSNATGSTVAGGVGSLNVGGLVGNSGGSLTNSYASGVIVSGGNGIGGLVGYSGGSLTDSYMTAGSVTGTSEYGGLVGFHAGTITNSHYNINGVTINGANIVTVGGLYNDSTANAQGIGQYDDWLIDKALNIADYTVVSGGSTFDNGFTDIYTISNAQGLKDMLGFADNSGYTFVLTADIDLTALGNFYIPILASDFDGADLTISNLSLAQDNSNLGMFGKVTSLGSVSNLTVRNATINSAVGVGIGGLAGSNVGAINKSSVVSAGVGTVTVAGGTQVGGLVGSNAGTISNSSVSGLGGTLTVSGISQVGGLAGQLFTGSITGSHVSAANVAGTDNVGGLVGMSNYGSSITNSYVNSGTITASVGHIGGLIGLESGTHTNSYFDIDNVTTNGGNNVTIGGLYNTGGGGQFNNWFNGGLLTPLEITTYASLAPLGGGVYGISNQQGMKDMLGFADDPAYNFSLTGNIDLTGLPGYYVPKLAGDFNGNSFTISNLSLTLPNYDMGLFGTTSTTSVVSNLNLVNARVNGYGNVGGLVGSNFGNIDNVSVGVNAVNGISAVGGSAGGLVGQNNGGSYITGTGTTATQIITGNISNSYVNGGTVSSNNTDAGGLVGYNLLGNIDLSGVTNTAVSGSSNVGGLVGNNQGSAFWSVGTKIGNIANSYVSGGSVTGTGGALSGAIGGLVGLNNNSDISTSWVLTPNVNGGAASMVGGLVGGNNTTSQSGTFYHGIISNSYVSGGIVSSLGNDVGGLVGKNFGVPIDFSHVDSVIVTGVLNVGGLVGYDSGEGWGGGIGLISDSYALNTQVTGESKVGGLVGMVAAPTTFQSSDNFDAVINSYVSGGTVSSNATSSASAIGGLVGYNSYGNISNSYVTNGTVVNGGIARDVGGLVGYNIGSSKNIWNGTAWVPTTPYNGIISNSYVSGGTVSGDNRVGGLVGNNASFGFNDIGYIDSSYVLTTSVTGGYDVGGLVGGNNGSIGDSYVSGGTVVNGGIASNVGGLAGRNDGMISGSSATAVIAVGDYSNNIGGLVGNSTGNIDLSVASGSITVGLGSYYIGGLVGWFDNGITPTSVTNSVANSSVAVGDSSNNIGGLIGYLGMNNSVSGSSATGSVTVGQFSNTIGGLMGGASGTIDNSFATGNVTVGLGSNTIGGLAGRSSGTINNSHAIGLVLVDSSSNNIGGLVGSASGAISGSYATGNVTAGLNSNTIGGLVGYKSVLGISNSYALGAVSVGDSSNSIGGLVGYASGVTIDQSHATGNVAGGIANNSIGGLVGSTWGTAISNSYATGVLTVGAGDVLALTTSNSIGGLVGYGAASTISNSFATGSITVGAYNTNIGGLVGDNSFFTGPVSSITDSYATGNISGGEANVGGLVGYNTGNLLSTYSTGTVSGTLKVGGLVGWNDTGGTVSGSYWNLDTAVGATFGIGLDTLLTTGTDNGAAPLTTAQMHNISSFTGWNIANIGGVGLTWRIYEGNTTPLLTSFLTPISVTGGNIVKTYDGLAYTGNYSIPNPVLANLFGGVGYQGVVNAGTYALDSSGMYSNQQGYDIDIVGSATGTLTVDPAELIVTADAKSKFQGAFDPLLTYMFTGLVGGDTQQTLKGSLSRVAGEVAGRYQIQQGSLSAGSNYSITYHPNDLVIKAAPANLTPTEDRIIGSINNTVIIALAPFELVPTDAAAATKTAEEEKQAAEDAVVAGENAVVTEDIPTVQPLPICQ